MNSERMTKSNVGNGIGGGFHVGRYFDKRSSFFAISGAVLFFQYLFFIMYAEWSYDSELFRNNKLVLDSLVLSSVDLVALISVYRILGSNIKSRVAKRFYSVLAMSFLFAGIAVSLYYLVSEQVGVLRYGYISKVSLVPVIFIVLPIQALYLFYWGIVLVRGHQIRYFVPKIEIAVFLVFSLIAILAIIIGFSGISTTGNI